MCWHQLAQSVCTTWGGPVWPAPYCVVTPPPNAQWLHAKHFLPLKFCNCGFGCLQGCHQNFLLWCTTLVTNSSNLLHKAVETHGSDPTDGLRVIQMSKLLCILFGLLSIQTVLHRSPKIIAVHQPYVNIRLCNSTLLFCLPKTSWKLLIVVTTVQFVVDLLCTSFLAKISLVGQVSNLYTTALWSNLAV